VRWLPVTVAPHAHTDVGNDNTSGLSGTVGTEMLASMPFKTQKSSSVKKKKIIIIIIIITHFLLGRIMRQIFWL